MTFSPVHASTLPASLSPDCALTNSHLLSLSLPQLPQPPSPPSMPQLLKPSCLPRPTINSTRLPTSLFPALIFPSSLPYLVFPSSVPTFIHLCHICLSHSCLDYLKVPSLLLIHLSSPLPVSHPLFTMSIVLFSLSFLPLNLSPFPLPTTSLACQVNLFSQITVLWYRLKKRLKKQISTNLTGKETPT